VARLLVLFVTAFVDMVGLTMILPLLPYYATEYGATATIVGVLISAFSIAQLLVAPAWGRYSDRFGRRPAIIAGLLITAVGYALFGLAGSVGLLLLSRVVQGLGGGTIGVVQAYVADASTPAQRTRSLGWLSAVTSLGAVVGPAIGSVLVRLGGQMLPGLAAAGFSGLVAVIGWKYLREMPMIRTPRPDRRSKADAIAGAALAAETGEVAVMPASSRTAIKRVLTRWREPAPRLIWTYALGIGAFYGTIPIVPLLLQDRLGVTQGTVGYFIMYLGGMGVLMRAFILGPLVDRLGEPRLARIGIALLAAGLAATAIGTTLPLIGVGFTLMPLGTACLFPCVTALLSGEVRSHERGLYLGVQQTFGGITRVGFPILAGLAMDRAGMGTPFAIGAALVLLSLPLMRGFRAAGGGAAQTAA